MKDLLHKLFDYQRFEPNEKLTEVIDEVESKRPFALTEEELSRVAGGVSLEQMMQYKNPNNLQQ